MNSKVEEIIDTLKKLTLLEASELVTKIEKTFGVESTPTLSQNVSISSEETSMILKEAVEEKTSFDVVLEDVVSEKRVAVLKVIRNVTSLGLKEAKELTTSLPKIIKEAVAKEEANSIKQALEEAGGKVKIE